MSDLDERSYQEALKFYSYGDLETALTKLSDVVNPNHYMTNYLKGSIYLKKRELDDALKYFYKCEELEPNNKYAILKFITYYSERKNEPKVIEYLNKAKRICQLPKEKFEYKKLN